MNLRILSAAALMLLFNGCASFSQPDPKKQMFSIELPLHAQAPGTDHVAEAVLLVKPLHVAPPFDGLAFLYRVGPSQYQSDYYNGFVASPEQLMTADMLEYFTAAKRFRAVVGGTSTVPHQLAVEGIITRLEGDYTDRSSPKAVVAAHLFLLDETQSPVKIVLDKQYEAAEAFSPASPEALAAAMGRAYERVLGEFLRDVVARENGGETAGARAE